jgi:hypothetical protein
MLFLQHAGEVVQLAYVLTNTGNVTITNLMVDAPNVFVPYECKLNMQLHNASTTVLLPGSVLHCKASHTVTLEDLEGSEYKVTVSATDEATGLNVFKDLMVYAQHLPQVSMQVREQDCSSMPAEAGKLGS